MQAKWADSMDQAGIQHDHADRGGRPVRQPGNTDQVPSASKTKSLFARHAAALTWLVTV
jgi:hypothetical protein